MAEQCVKHTFDMAEGRCRNCGYLYCGRCLVFAKGPNKPPYCLSCAMAAGGVRSTAAHAPIAPRSELKRAEKERRKAQRAAAKAARRRPVPEPEARPRPGVIPGPRGAVPSRSPAAGWGQAP